LSRYVSDSSGHFHFTHLKISGMKTLTLIIKQIYFDQILAGTKTIDQALEDAQIGAKAEMDEAKKNFGQ